jgi:hypothetical protein
VLELTLSLADAGALRELYDKQLALRRAFVPGACGAAALTACELILEQGGRTHRLAAEVVFVKEEEPGRGVGVQLAPLDEDAMAALRGFVELAPDGDVTGEPPPSGTTEEAETEDDDPAGPGTEGPARSLQERLRSLSTVEQQKIAAGGTLTERVALERMYGPNVWETLLRNPRLTIPEVARIGRKGTLPRPLVETIAANASWLVTTEVQRALLSNPRSSQAVVMKVLQMMSRSDLQLVPQQTAYPPLVRQTAKKMLTR